MTDIIIGPNDAISIIYYAVADSIISKGQPIYLKANGHIDLARADAVGTSKVTGLLLEGVVPTFIGSYSKDGSVTMDDWNEVIGLTYLVPGSVYYLDPDILGRLTRICPTSVGQWVCQIGQAVTTTTLAMEISLRILL